MPEVSEKTVLPSGTITPYQKTYTHNALPMGTQMGEFEIIDLVGEGGFGIVYLVLDHLLERKVALKEYMPSMIAARITDTHLQKTTVALRSEDHREAFETGRRSFVNEARLLAKFDHPALVKVHRFWEANGTAYMVMPYYEGATLRAVLKSRTSPPGEDWIRKVLLPVIEALEVIHRDNCFHRDVAPDNIILLRDESPVLLDFGAARRVVGDMTQAFTVIVKAGFAPIEQYGDMPDTQQGAWTDIYALGAVIHFMITGKAPPPSIGRLMHDSYQPLAMVAAGRYRDAFLRGVDRCLAVKAEERPQTMTRMREALGWGTDYVASSPATVTANLKPHGGNKVTVPVAGGVLAVGLAAALGGYWFLRGDTPASVPEPPQQLVQQPPSFAPPAPVAAPPAPVVPPVAVAPPEPVVPPVAVAPPTPVAPPAPPTRPAPPPARPAPPPASVRTTPSAYPVPAESFVEVPRFVILDGYRSNASRVVHDSVLKGARKHGWEIVSDYRNTVRLQIIRRKLVVIIDVRIINNGVSINAVTGKASSRWIKNLIESSRAAAGKIAKTSG
jgi:serine/threonine protein kinase